MIFLTAYLRPLTVAMFKRLILFLSKTVLTSTSSRLSIYLSVLRSALMGDIERRVTIVRLLLNFDANPLVREGYRTLLEDAVHVGNTMVDAVEAFLDTRPEVDPFDYVNVFTLNILYEDNENRMIQLLLDHSESITTIEQLQKHVATMNWCIKAHEMVHPTSHHTFLHFFSIISFVTYPK
jgi:hypothetical protein